MREGRVRISVRPRMTAERVLQVVGDGAQDLGLELVRAAQTCPLRSETLIGSEVSSAVRCEHALAPA